MSSIVLELQQELLQRDCDVIQVLRKAHLYALKHNLQEFDMWIQYELNGYSGHMEAIPSYRKVTGNVKAKNVFGIWAPVIKENGVLDKELSTRPLHHDLPALVELYEKSGEHEIFFSYPEEKIKATIDESIMGYPMDMALFIQSSQIKSIIESVKNTLLERLIEIERSGVENMRINTQPKLFELIDATPEIKKLFKVTDIKGFPRSESIYSEPEFIAWGEEIKAELRKLKQDELIKEIFELFGKFTGWTDKKLFETVATKLKVLKDNYNDYIVAEKRDESLVPDDMLPVKGEDNTMMPIIFISHRTEDAGVADMLRDYLIATGIPNEYVFCSSLPGNDVKSVISREVKDKIANSAVNIAILSRGYYESAYCINEAGIIWLQEPQTPALVVGLPEISHANMYGFLNSDYKLRRLDNTNDISEIYDTVREAVGATPASLSVATAASQKLLARYAEYLNSRAVPAVPAAQPTTSTATIEDVTTDDERVVLYYILTKKIRRVQKSDIHAWMTENEIYNINVENDLDLLASLGAGTYEKETLNMDVDIFRQYTANADELILGLAPIVERYQTLSSKRFIELWNAGAFTDEDKLFVAYIIQNRAITFGARWREEGQIKSIHQWESNNCLDGSLASTYSAHLNQFVENQFVYESDWTDHGNAREYTLCPSLKNLLLSADFPYVSELEAVMNAHKVTLPF